MYSVEHASSMDPTVMEEGGGGVTGSGPDSAPPPPTTHAHTPHSTAKCRSFRISFRRVKLGRSKWQFLFGGGGVSEEVETLGEFRSSASFK